MLFVCLVQPYLGWSYSSRRNVFFVNGWLMGWTWLKQNWNKRPLNVFLCASVFGSMFVKIHCWLFECPLVGLRVKEPRPNNLWCSCTSRLGGCWKCFICKTSDMLMLALRNRSCMPALRRTKSCRTWDWMLQMLFLVALWWLIIPTQFTVSISFPMLREPCFAWFLAPPDDLLIAPVRYWPN